MNRLNIQVQIPCMTATNLWHVRLCDLTRTHKVHDMVHILNYGDLDIPNFTLYSYYVVPPHSFPQEIVGCVQNY